MKEKEKNKTSEEIIENEEILEENEEINEEEKVDKDKIIESLENKVKELEEKNIRVTAEMVNSLRRKEEENSRLMKYANESLILEILPVIDNFERALNAEVSDENYKKGMEMIYNNLINTLNKFEVKEIDAKEKDFDPTFHQAVMTEHIEGKKENEVIEVLQKGYTYKDKVIRPAMVKVNM